MDDETKKDIRTIRNELIALGTVASALRMVAEINHLPSVDEIWDGSEGLAALDRLEDKL